MTGFRTFGHGLGIEYAARSMLAFEFYGQAFARWLQEQNTGRPVCYEKVKTGEEQILEDREQRELDGVPSLLAIRNDRD